MIPVLQMFHLLMVTDISNANGFTIVVGKINSSGSISDTANYFTCKYAVQQLREEYLEEVWDVLQVQ
jgi:hypothetical protein